jgi:hypothetical protein
VPGRGAQADGDRDGLVVGEQERRHRGARLEPVATRGSAGRADGIAERPEAPDVAPDGALAHLQAPRELGARPLAARLEEGEQLEQPG